jgi:hypothetical protein
MPESKNLKSLTKRTVSEIAKKIFRNGHASKLLIGKEVEKSGCGLDIDHLSYVTV